MSQASARSRGGIVTDVSRPWEETPQAFAQRLAGVVADVNQTRHVWDACAGFPDRLLDLIRREAPLPADAQTHENLLEMHSLRLATLLLSVCHVVIAVQDASFDNPRTTRAREDRCCFWRTRRF